MKITLCHALVAAVALASSSVRVMAQSSIAPSRTWDELKAETQARAERGAYPLAGLPASEVAEALARIRSLDRDEWAAGFSAIGQRYLDSAASKPGKPAEARAAYLMAWRFFSFAAWPVTNSAGKRDAYRKAIAAFREYAALLDTPPELVRIPYESAEIIGYLGLPTVRPAPLVITVAGLDSRKENTVDRGSAYFAHGLGYFALDLPGTGESPVKVVDPAAERMFSKVLDYLRTRSEVDSARIAIQGSSWGSYWAARMGIVERQRLRAALVQGGPVHGYFQAEWQTKALGTREYLFDLFPARASLYGVRSVDEFLAYGPRMSLENGGLIDQPATRMLLINGAHDTQVPIDDLYRLLRSGSPKEAWVNPQGGHMGRSRDWPDERIFREVVLPWLETALKR